MKKIAVVGATGMLGQPVTREMVAAGFDLTLLVRDLAKAQTIFGSAVRYVTGGLDDRPSLVKLLEDQEGLYINLSVEQTSSKKGFQPEREGLNLLLDVAGQSRLQRIGYLSSLVQFYQGQNGFNWWVFDIKQRAVNKIKNCGIPYSIFYPSTFMESFDKGGYRQGKSIALAGISRYKMFLIGGSDYGKQVVRAFQINSGNHEYTVQGREGFTADEAARFFVDHYDRSKVEILKAPVGLLKFLGNFSNKFNYGAHIVEALNNYPEKFESEKTWQELGTPQTRFIDYIRNSG